MLSVICFLRHTHPTKIHSYVLKDKLQQYIKWEKTPSNKKQNKLPLDVLPNISRMQAAEGSKNAVFCPW